MISNRCARKSLLINCNSIISKNYLRFLVDNNDISLFFAVKKVIKTILQTAKIQMIFRISQECFVFLQKSYPLIHAHRTKNYPH